MITCPADTECSLRHGSRATRPKGARLADHTGHTVRSVAIPDDPSETLRPFAVPITEPFALLTANSLTAMRDLVADTLAGDEPADLDPACLFLQEAAQLTSLGAPVGENRRSLLAMLVGVANDPWQNALDLVRAIANDMMRTPPPVWSSLTLARAVMEACLLTHYLLDDSISVSKRLARLAGVWHTDAEYQRKTAAAWHKDVPADVMMSGYARAALAECQITEKINKHGAVCGFIVGSESAPLDMNITEQAAKALPDWMPEPYRLASGAAHSRPWVIARGTALAEGTGQPFVGEAATLATALMVVVGSLMAAHRAWNSYFALGRDHVAEQLHQRMVSYLHAAMLLTSWERD